MVQMTCACRRGGSLLPCCAGLAGAVLSATLLVALALTAARPSLCPRCSFANRHSTYQAPRCASPPRWGAPAAAPPPAGEAQAAGCSVEDDEAYALQLQYDEQRRYEAELQQWQQQAAAGDAAESGSEEEGAPLPPAAPGSYAAIAKKQEQQQEAGAAVEEEEAQREPAPVLSSEAAFPALAGGAKAAAAAEVAGGGGKRAASVGSGSDSAPITGKPAPCMVCAQPGQAHALRRGVPPQLWPHRLHGC